MPLASTILFMANRGARLTAALQSRQGLELLWLCEMTVALPGTGGLCTSFEEFAAAAQASSKQPLALTVTAGRRPERLRAA